MTLHIENETFWGALNLSAINQSNYGVCQVRCLTDLWELWTKKSFLKTLMKTNMPGLLGGNMAALFLDNFKAWAQPNSTMSPEDLELRLVGNSSLKSSHNRSIFSSSSSAATFLDDTFEPFSTYEKLFLSWCFFSGLSGKQSSSSLVEHSFAFLSRKTSGDAAGDRRHKGGESIPQGYKAAVVGKLNSSVLAMAWRWSALSKHERAKRSTS